MFAAGMMMEIAGLAVFVGAFLAFGLAVICLRLARRWRNGDRIGTKGWIALSAATAMVAFDLAIICFYWYLITHRG
jgi:hypothetical protein